MNFGIEAGKLTLELAVELGVRGIPISADVVAAQGVVAALAPLRERGLAACQISAFGYNPLSGDDARRTAQRTVVERAIEACGEVGCRYVVISGGNYHASTFGGTDRRNFTSAALDAVAIEIAPLVRKAERCDALLCIEPYLKTAVCSADAFCALHARVGSASLRANIDVTSLYDFADLVDPSAKIAHTIAGLGLHAGLVHVKEVGLADGFHLHAGLVPVGQGATDWEDVLRRVSEHVADDAWVILEHVASAPDGRAAVDLLRRCAARAGTTLE